MSFQRDLTGSSNLYANVILNTNISASSVSTVNLSATNASFTNITTNTWTTGNVSTPNVIATNGYFSNLYISTESVSTFNICSLNACNIYASNSSITNLSTSFINASTVRAFITNQSTANVCLVATSTIYSTYGYISNISVSSISVNASLDVDGDIIGVTGRFQHFQTKNAGGNTQFEIEQVGNYTNLNIVNSGVQSMEFTRLNSSLMSLNSSQCVFWNPTYTSNAYASSANITNLSTSNISNSSLISTSTLSAYITNVSTENSCLVNTSTIYSTYSYISNISVSSISVNASLDIDGDVIAVTGRFQHFQTKNAGGNTQFEIEQVGNYTNLNVVNSGVQSMEFTRLNSSLMSLNASQCVFWNPVYTSNAYASLASISNLSTSNISNSSLISTSTLSAYITNVSTGYCFINNASTTNTITANISTLNVSTYTSISSSYRANFSSISASNISCTALTASSDIEAKSALITNNGVIFKEFNSSSMIPIYANIYETSTSSASTWLFEGFGVNNILFNVYGTDTLNISENYLSAANGTLNISNISTKHISSTNMSVTGRISVSNVSATSISATGRINADNIVIANNITSNGGTFQGPFGSFATLSASALSVSQGVSCNFVTTTQVSSTSIATSWLNASNISVSTIAITTLSGTTTNFSTGNFSSIAVSNAVVNMCVSTLYTSFLRFATNGTASTYGDISLTGGKMFIQSIGSTATGVQIGNSGNLRFEVSINGTSSFVPFYASTGNFSTLNTCTFSPANINTTTMTCTTVNATTGNFSTLNTSTFAPATINTTTLNASTGNFSSLNASTWNLPSTISATTLNASTGNFSSLNASTWNLPATITTSTLNASTGNFSTVNANTVSVSSISVSNLSVISNLTVSTATVSRINVCNACILNLSIADTITAGDANISYIFSETIYPNYIVAALGGEFADTIYVSKLDVEKINNSFSTINTTQPLTLYSVSNTTGTGLRVPTYIDSQDLGALTIGYNQTTGFINVCRATRVYGNVLTDNNFNTITATTDLGVGTNLTSGNLKLGSTTMTGNISIDTTGDVVFGCDRRSTWNTSDLIQFSTQIGSHYSVTSVVSSGSVSGTNLSRLYYPTPANISLLDMPVGLYLVSITGALRGFSGYDAIPSNCYAGICYGTNASFTNANTTRNQVKYVFAPNLYSNASTANVVDMSFTGLINMSITGQKIGAYIQYQATNLASAGSVAMTFTGINVVKIA